MSRRFLIPAIEHRDASRHGARARIVRAVLGSWLALFLLGLMLGTGSAIAQEGDPWIILPPGTSELPPGTLDLPPGAIDMPSGPGDLVFIRPRPPNPKTSYPSQLRLRGVTDGAGYNDGFFSVEAFQTLRHTRGENLSFFDGRAFMAVPLQEGLNDFVAGMNLGLAHRIFRFPTDRIWGAYLFYDYRNTGTNDFNQISAGFDNLGLLWDYRGNIYAPVGTTGALQSEAAMTGFDFEAGRLLYTSDKVQFRGLGGMYYFNAQGGEQVVGIESRAELRYTNNAIASLSVQHDNVFDTHVMFNLLVSWPFTDFRGSYRMDSAVDRLGDPIIRRQNIMVQTQGP